MIVGAHREVGVNTHYVVMASMINISRNESLFGFGAAIQRHPDG
jgi:hypothetical protein